MFIGNVSRLSALFVMHCRHMNRAIPNRMNEKLRLVAGDAHVQWKTNVPGYLVENREKMDFPFSPIA